MNWNRLLDIYRGSVCERSICGDIGLSIVNELGQKVSSHSFSNSMVFGRSLLKPLQMKPLIKDLDLILSPEQKAVSISSHFASEEHQKIAQSILPSSLHHLMRVAWSHPCSGKHAAILRACALRGWDGESFLDLNHPYNQEFKSVLEGQLGHAIEPSHVGCDGCGLPTFAMGVEELAFLFAKFALTKNQDWIWPAAVGHPELVGGGGRLDTLVMSSCSDFFAKEGADGLLGLATFDKASNRSMGIVLKLAHGYDMNMAWHIAVEILKQVFGLSLPEPAELSGQTKKFHLDPVKKWAH